MCRLLDRELLIDPTWDVNFKKKINGDVSLEKAFFEDPTPPNIVLIRAMCVEVKKYSSELGGAVLRCAQWKSKDKRHSQNVEHDVKWVRKNVGLVAQEPDLFNRSVRDNISYGLDYVKETPVTDEMIAEAAKTANAHSFITEREDGTASTGGDRICLRTRAENSGAGRGDVSTGRGFRARSSEVTGSGGEGAYDDCRGVPVVYGEGRGRNCSGGTCQDRGDQTTRRAATNRERGVCEPDENPTEWREENDVVSTGNLGRGGSSRHYSKERLLAGQETGALRYDEILITFVSRNLKRACGENMPARGAV
ncbi:Type I protein exporter [Gracilaria domingensis]|nr:Type I protein exporter [Gracilaria domingensis]